MPDQYQSSAVGQALRGRGGRYDRAMYYRRPTHDRHGQELEQAGWIVIGSRTHMENMIVRGFEPLHKYGYIPYVDPELKEDDGKSPAPLRSPWYPILATPTGPQEFPVEQVMTFRWYDTARLKRDVGIENVRFPQLQGHKVIHYPCPECKRTPFIAIDTVGGIGPLATHLRLIHEWDRQSIMAYGDRVGIDFNAIYGDLRETIEFGFGEATLQCDECDYTVPPESKKPDAALRMHKMHGHKPLEVESVG